LTEALRKKAELPCVTTFIEESEAKVDQRHLLAHGSRKTSGIGQRTLQLGSPAGGVNFFNAICRLLIYEGSFSTRFSDLLISTDSFVCAESVSAGVGLRSSFSVSMDPLQLINTMVSSTAIILNTSQVGCTRELKMLFATTTPLIIVTIIPGFAVLSR
jgi:hypothetical protein